MDATSAMICPAVLFTLLAVIIAAFIIAKLHHPEIKHQSNANSCKPTETQLVKDSATDHEEDALNSSTAHPTRWREDSSELGIQNALKDYAQSPDHPRSVSVNAEEKPLKYMAGILRARQLEKMMTREELEEEQRVQQEQLSAIFQLLRDKQDTFGDVTESDLEELLKLYSV